MTAERDIYEVANQLQGFAGPNTDPDLASFLFREGTEAGRLADEITRLRTALATEYARGIEDAAEIVSGDNTTLVSGAGTADYWNGCRDTQRAAYAAIRALVPKP